MSRAGSRTTSEAEFLDKEASNARSALGGAFRSLGTDLREGLSVRSWVRQFPWASIGLGALAGLAAGHAARASVHRGGARARKLRDGVQPGSAGCPPRQPKRRRRSGALQRLLAVPAGPLLLRALRGAAPPGRPPARLAGEVLPADRGTRPFDAAPLRPRPDEPGGSPAAQRPRRAGPEGGRRPGSRLRTIWTLFRRTLSEFSEDNCFRLAAALSYYTVFSLAPLLLIVIAVVGLVYQRETAQAEILAQMEGLVGEKGSQGVQALLEGAAANPSENILATVLGIGALILGASGVFAQLKDSLNTIWEVKPRPGMGIVRWLKDRILSFGIVIGIGFLLLVWLVLSAALAAAGKYLESLLPLPPAVLHAMNLAVSFAVITVLFAMIYKLLPDVKLAWRHVFIGALITAGLFTLGKFLIGLYLGHTAVSSSFGAAGSVLIILLWAYYSALVFLLGAEFTQVYAHATRPDLIVHEDSVPVTEEERAQEGVPRKRSPAR